MWLLRKLILILTIPVALLILLFVWLTPQDTLVKADVIVAISGGDTDARTREAVRLYQEGWAPKLLFSGAALDPLSPSNAEVMQEIGRAAGVPDEAIDIGELAQNTEQNASESKLIINARDYDSIILVTSPYHQRRAYLEFRDELGDDVQIINWSSADENWSDNWWFASPQSWYLLGTEGIKTSLTVIKNTF